MKKNKIISVLTEKWPNNLRLLINNECNYRCSFPNTKNIWCHEDGPHYSRAKNLTTDVDDFIFLSKIFKKTFSLNKVKIGGREPLLYKNLPSLIAGLKGLGFPEVSLTTNGYYLEEKAEALKVAGLDTLTISLHAFNKDLYKKITGVDSFNKVLLGIEKSRGLNFTKIKINRVMINFENAYDDLINLLRWAEKKNLTVKIYQLIWLNNRSEKQFFNNYLSWNALLPFLSKNGNLSKIIEYSISGRERMFWKLKSGLEIETDVFSSKTKKTRPHICRICSFSSVCQEGIFSNGIEINSELTISPCLLRKDLSISLYKSIRGRNEDLLKWQAKKIIKQFEI